MKKLKFVINTHHKFVKCENSETSEAAAQKIVSPFLIYGCVTKRTCMYVQNLFIFYLQLKLFF